MAKKKTKKNEINKAVAEELNGRIDMDKQDQKFVTPDDNGLPF